MVAPAQKKREVSLPTHLRFASTMVPVPWLLVVVLKVAPTPKKREKKDINVLWLFIKIVFSTLSCNHAFSLPVPENPSCLQATLASAVPKPASQAVPQALLLQTSTLPVRALLPPLRRMWFCRQTAAGKERYVIIKLK